MQFGQTCVLFSAGIRIISEVTIPVGTAMIAYPMIITMLARNCPKPVAGEISPYPTVVSVTTAQ